jgi:hypothetical protein
VKPLHLSILGGGPAGLEERLEKIGAFLACFENLRISGRSGKFVYAHVHDMLQFGREIIDGYRKARTGK